MGRQRWRPRQEKMEEGPCGVHLRLIYHRGNVGGFFYFSPPHRQKQQSFSIRMCSSKSSFLRPNLRSDWSTATDRTNIRPTVISFSLFFNGGKNSYGRQRDESFQEGEKKKKMADTMCKTWLVANISAFGRTMLSPRIEITCVSLFSFHWTLRPLLFFKTIVNDRSNTVVPPIFPTRNSKLLNERIIFKLKKTQPRTKILKEKKMAFVYLPSGVGTRRRDSPFFLISTSAFVCGWSKDPSHTKSSRGRGFPVVVETPKLFFFFFCVLKGHNTKDTESLLFQFPQFQLLKWIKSEMFLQLGERKR